MPTTRPSGQGRRPDHRSPGREPARRRGRAANGTGRPWPSSSTPAGRLNLRDRDLKQIGRDQVGRVPDRAGPRGGRQSRSERRRSGSWPTISACKRPAPGCSTSSASSSSRPRCASSNRRRSRSWSATGPPAAYDEKEIEYPVLAGLSHFTSRDGSGQKRYDREGWPPGPGSGSTSTRPRRPAQQAARRNPRDAGRTQPELSSEIRRSAGGVEPPHERAAGRADGRGS